MKYAQQSDVLLHEVFIEGEIKEINKMRTQKTLHNVQSYHTTSSQVGKVAFIARTKKLVLTHFVPTRFNKNNLKKVVKKDFGKDPIIGEDLMTIKV
jgi:ribonuclease Z